MKIVTPGYLYLLDNFEEDSFGKQPLQFIQKEEVDGKFQTIANGTTNEEILAVLIDRITFLNKKMPHPDNDTALECLQTALAALNHRAEERRARGVKDSPAK